MTGRARLRDGRATRRGGWRALAVAVAVAALAIGCAETPGASAPAASRPAPTTTSTAAGASPIAVPGPLADLAGAGAVGDPGPPPAGAERPSVAPAQPDVAAGAGSDVADLLAQPGVEAVVATVTAQEGAIDVWADRPVDDGTVPAPASAVPVVNEFGGPARFLVQEQVGPWLRVQLPVRPNGSEGWVAQAQVTLAAVAHRVEISLSERRLRVLQGDEVVLESRVAVGRPDAPTPTGRFYLRDSFAWDPHSAYGPYVLPLSGYSESIDVINGGEAVIAIHGTNRPESVGRAASLGCLRTDNETITALAHLIAPGTPVVIST